MPSGLANGGASTAAGVDRDHGAGPEVRSRCRRNGTTYAVVMSQEGPHRRVSPQGAYRSIGGPSS